MLRGSPIGCKGIVAEAGESRTDDLQDSRQDIYTLEDGQSIDAAR